MKKRFLFLLLVLSLVAASLVACGKKKEGGKTSDKIDVESLRGTEITVYTHMGQRVLGEEKKDADGNTYRDESTAILAHLA